MEYVIIVLLLLIFLLLTYLFLEKKELRRIRKEIQVVKSCETNASLHSEFQARELQLLIGDLDLLLSDMKGKEIDVARKNESLMKMMTNISHDLRTPLTSALGYITLVIQSDLSKEEQQKMLLIIEERLKRLEELIHSFFEFSKIVSQNKTPQLEAVNLIAVLESCIAHYYEDYAQEQREVLFHTPTCKLEFQSNPILLMRIFDNLIYNAYKHSCGNLEIEVQQTEDTIQVCFTNQLPTMELDTDKMFDEFYTIDISRTKSNTGLGLAIAKEFAEQLHGSIFAEKQGNQLNIILQFQQIL